MVAAALGNDGRYGEGGVALVPITSSECWKNKSLGLEGSPQSLLGLIGKGTTGGTETLWVAMKVR